MYMKLKNLLLVAVLFIFCVGLIKSNEVVCSESELVKELKEDLADNGKLDCLRDSLPVPNETNDEKIKRIAANWDGDCSFESDNEEAPWNKRLLDIYPIFRGLIDVNGNTTNDQNQPDQADMCEIVRSLIGNNMIEGITMVGDSVTSLNEDISYYIDCPGGGSESSICAATGSSFADPKGWVIFLDGQSIKFGDKPTYEVNRDSNSS